MKYFQHKMSGSKIHIYPLVCWHLGAKQTCTPLINEVIKRVNADPVGRAIYLGDAGECVTPKSKGNMNEQLTSPGDQMREAAGLFKRVTKGKLLGGIRGNHGNRLDKEVGIGWDEILCARAGVPYWGVSGFGDVILKFGKNQLRTCSLYVHHGNGSGITPGGKVMAAQKPKDIVWADIAITAHTHMCGETQPRQLAFTDPASGRIEWRTMRLFAAGSSYDPRSGYAEEKQYPPILPQHLIVKVRATKEGLDITHETIEDFGYVGEENKEKWTLTS